MTDPTLYPQIPRWGPDNPPPRIIRDQPLFDSPQETTMLSTNDIAIATSAAEKVIRDDENKYAGAFKRLIPDDAPHKLAVEIVNAIAADLAKAHAGK